MESLAPRPRTVSETFRHTAQQFSAKSAIRYTIPKSKCGETFEGNFDQIVYTWQEFDQQARAFSKALIAQGVKPQQAVTIQGSNSPQWLFANVGTILAGGISAGVYPTNNSETSKHAACNSNAKVVVVEDEAQLKKYEGIESTAIKCFVVWNKVQNKNLNLPAPVLSWKKFLREGSGIPDDKVDRRIAKQTPDQICSLIYTSGTTGLPKGAALTHDNLTFVTESAGNLFSVDHSDRTLSYLPLSHIASQQLDCMVPVTTGSQVEIAPRDALKGTNLKQHIVHARPTYFLAVPRVWEKFKEVIEEKLVHASLFKKTLFNVGTSFAKGAFERAERFEMNPDMTYLDSLLHKVDALGLRIFEKLLYSRVKEALGLDQCKIAASGAGILDPQVSSFFAGLNIRILDLYGMSESAGLISYEGNALPNTEIKIGEENEILVRGRHVFKEYWNNPQATKEALDEEGFLHTGDIGMLDDTGHLRITGRLKELIKTSGGENIPPIRIEQRLQRELPLLSQALVIGDRRNFLTCLFTLKTELDANGNPTNILSPEVVELLRDLGSEAKTVTEAAKDSAVEKYLQEGVDRANRQADSQAQRIGKFKILSDDFTVANGLMTPTMKVRRNEVAKRFAPLIEEMYA